MKSSSVAGRKETTKPINYTTAPSSYITSLVWSPTIAAFPLFAILLTLPKYRWNMGNSSGKRKNYNTVRLKFPENASTVHKYTHAHRYIYCFLFLQSHSFSQALDTNSQVIHRNRKLLDLVFSCLLILTPTKNYWRYETAEVTKTIKQLHSCGVLSFFISFSYSQIHKIQQLVVGHHVIH